MPGGQGEFERQEVARTLTCALLGLRMFVRNAHTLGILKPESTLFRTAVQELQAAALQTAAAHNIARLPRGTIEVQWDYDTVGPAELLQEARRVLDELSSP